MDRWLIDTLSGLSPAWIYLLVGTLATVEAVFIGLVLPGELALLLGGFLAFHHRVSLPGLLVVAAAAGIGGYLLGYEVGRQFGPALRTSRIGRRIGPARWDRVQAALAARGGRAILFGRLIGLLRAVMPAAAGMAHMPYRTFLTYSVVGGLLWGPGFVLLGYAAGGSYQKIAQLVGQASLVLLILIVVISVMAVAARWVAAHPDRIHAAVARQLDRPAVAALRQRYHRQLAFLARRFSPAGALGLSLTLGLLAIVASGWAFGGILEDVLGREELATHDSPVTAWLAGHRTDWLTTVMRAVTTLGSGWVTVPVLILVGVLLARPEHRRQSAGMLILIAAGTSTLVTAIKLLIGRARPDITDLLTNAAGYAFPSGHSAQAVATYATLAYLLSARLRRWRPQVAVWTVAALIVLLVGFSRLYLGAHWLTDVLGGYALGAAWTALVITATATIRRTRATAPPGTPPLPTAPPAH